MTLSNRKSLSWSPSVSIAIKKSLSCVSSLAHFIDLPGRWCSSQRMLVLHLCNRLRSLKTPPHANHLEQSLLCCEDWVRFPFKNLSHCIWAISPPLSILRKSNCPRLMPQECVKKSSCMIMSISPIQKTKSSKYGTFLNKVYTHSILLGNVLL